MKRNKVVRMAVFAAVLTLLTGTAACGKGSQEERHVVSDAKMDLYESAQDLEADATLIVRAQKTDEEKNVAEKSGPYVYFGRTESMVEVKEIMKHTTDQDVAIGDRIRIVEKQFTYKDGDGAQVTDHLSRYKKMEPGKEYFLYLDYSPSDEWFYILSGLFGKVPVSEDEELLYPMSGITTYNGQAYEDDGLDQIMEHIRQSSLELYPVKE